MPNYNNLSGKSNVRFFEIKGTGIIVTFIDNKSYLYSYSSAGRGHVEMMKQMAIKGIGLNSYINLHVRHKFESKW